MRLSPDEARRRFAEARIARLATVGADGAPHLVPVVFAVEGDLVHTIVDAKPKSTRDLARLRNVARSPRVALLVDHYDDDWSQLWWVRADGTGRVVGDGPERERAIALLRRRYPQYGAPDPVFGAAMIVQVDRWGGWSAR